MTRSEHYCAGKAEGELWAERDMADGLGVHHDQAACLREQASYSVNVRRWAKTQTANTDDFWAARTLGNARGYRDAVRTLRNGRWGT